ncbi:hypothetical protein GCM10025857_05570 [Alicyclobacillus contaminans]|uniref:DUF3055 domain-containing protein n=1 Tax=Alicyclobacillus contaminans TaxID=392016 RepID=UPI00042922DD|nr:DUF3055 domain-containing protein [Alicyclobacillus contaminans]GMA49200.1 hypothetical protein GCM10025857_05570 [Alicyclobacillus contaminans]
MDTTFILYDATESTTTRFVGYAGEGARFDLAITQTDHFYGKRLVYLIQSGKTAILDAEEASDIDYVQRVFGLTNTAEAEELSAFLVANL